MALKIRLQRHGAKGAPVYRIVVTEAKSPRDGRFTELLGTYSPKARGQDPRLKVKMDRVNYWKSVGAKPSDTVAGLLREIGRVEKDAESEVILANKATAAA